MTTAQMGTILTTTPEVTFRVPDVGDGVRLWEIARDSQVLDLNSSYAYVLWCQDYSRTSIVSEVDGRVVGFVTGYVRPQAPDTVMVWQVAVDSDQRGLGLAGRMLTALMDRAETDSITRMQTTISPDNDASQRLFSSFADKRGMTITRRDYFAPEDFPDSHEPEDLYTIAPRP